MSNFDGCIFLKKARVSFPNLAVARAPEGSTVKKYSADFLLTPDDPQFAAFMQLVTKIASDKWPSAYQNVLSAIQNDRKLRCYGQGSERLDKKTYQPMNGYAGMVYIAASRNEDKGMPQMIDAAGNGIDPDNALACQNEARKMYGGCYLNAVVRPWVQDNQYGRGVRCDLVAVQFAAAGEAFGAAVTDAAAMFAGAPVEQVPPAAPAVMPWAQPAAAPAGPFPWQ